MKLSLFSLLLLLFATQCFGNVAITNTSLPNGTVGTAYSSVVKASGGCAPYKWTIASGALPAGVTAKVSSTTYVAEPRWNAHKTAATYSFSVKVAGCGGAVLSDIVQDRRPGHGQPRRGCEVETLYVDQRGGLQCLSRSGRRDLEEGQCEPDCIDALCRLNRRQWQHVLLLGNSRRYQEP